MRLAFQHHWLSPLLRIDVHRNAMHSEFGRGKDVPTLLLLQKC